MKLWNWLRCYFTGHVHLMRWDGKLKACERCGKRWAPWL